jgi:hypothetical protein
MIYEVRTYTLRPGTVAEFEERFAKRLPLREKHSKLGAFWHTEVGPLNQVTVYPYATRTTADAVRNAPGGHTARQQLPAVGTRSSRRVRLRIRRRLRHRPGQPELRHWCVWMRTYTCLGDIQRC